MEMRDDTENTFRKLMEESGLSRYTDSILSLREESIHIACEAAPEEEFSPGQSKIGGLPDLPSEISWPLWTPPVIPKKPGFLAKLFENRIFSIPSCRNRQHSPKGNCERFQARFFGKQPQQPPKPEPSPLAFIAQFNLAEVAPYDTQKQLPNSGMLYFFMDVDWSYDSGHSEAWRVFHWNGDNSQLRRSVLPDGLGAKQIFRTFRLIFAAELMYPAWDSLYIEELGMTDDEMYEYGNVIDEKLIPASDNPVTRLLGHADNIQNGDMRIECVRSMENIRDASYPVISPENRKRALKWAFLFQIDSIDIDTHWADGGRFYYWIRKEDLQQCDFGNTCVTFQCY